jgi:hypothetical protein
MKHLSPDRVQNPVRAGLSFEIKSLNIPLISSIVLLI